jgi:hypothetical protein
MLIQALLLPPDYRTFVMIAPLYSTTNVLVYLLCTHLLQTCWMTTFTVLVTCKPSKILGLSFLIYFQSTSFGSLI